MEEEIKSVKCKNCDDEFFLDECKRELWEIHEKEPTDEKVLIFAYEKLLRHYCEMEFIYEWSRERKIEELRKLEFPVFVDSYGNFGVDDNLVKSFIHKKEENICVKCGRTLNKGDKCFCEIEEPRKLNHEEKIITNGLKQKNTIKKDDNHTPDGNNLSSGLEKQKFGTLSTEKENSGESVESLNSTTPSPLNFEKDMNAKKEQMLLHQVLEEHINKSPKGVRVETCENCIRLALNKGFKLGKKESAEDEK
jgi:hypothetical protein